MPLGTPQIVALRTATHRAAAHAPNRVFCACKTQNIDIQDSYKIERGTYSSPPALAGEERGRWFALQRRECTQMRALSCTALQSHPPKSALVGLHPLHVPDRRLAGSLCFKMLSPQLQQSTPAPPGSKSRPIVPPVLAQVLVWSKRRARDCCTCAGRLGTPGLTSWLDESSSRPQCRLGRREAAVRTASTNVCFHGCRSHDSSAAPLPSIPYPAATGAT